MKILVSILALFVATTTINAQFNKKIKGNGNMTTDTRTVSDFNKLGVAGSFDVELIKGTSGKVTVNADENLMDYIITEVKNGLLKVKSKKGYQVKSAKSIKITVSFDKLESISLAGSGDITSGDQINANDMKLSLSGSGNMDLSLDVNNLVGKIAGSGNMNLRGASDEFTGSIAGSGNINGSELNAGKTTAKIAGSGNIKVHAVNEIHANIAGSGNVHYTGNPKVEKSNTAGSGKLKKKS